MPEPRQVQSKATKFNPATAISALHGFAGALLLVAGCATTGPPTTGLDRITLRERAAQYLTEAARYPHNPAVRVAAIEALQARPPDVALPWIRAGLLDDHPGVRFAACVAVGVLRDDVARSSVVRCLQDPDASVQVAALFALHRLGDSRGTGRIATYLLDHPEPAVRRNAALVLGLLNEKNAVKVLAKAMKDPDPGVRQHALEAMARLGNAEATRELTFMTNSGVGSDEVFAIQALAATGNPKHKDTFRYKLENGAHLETRLAAARGLGRCGVDDGFDVALDALQRHGPYVSDVRDPVAGQALRHRLLAAAALAAIGRTDALPALTHVLENNDDPRVQVAAASAILAVLQGRDDLPFATTAAAHPQR